MSLVCKNCGTLNAVGAKTCRVCYALLQSEAEDAPALDTEVQRRCPRCHGRVLKKLRFCNFCGQTMSASDDAQEESHAQLEDENRGIGLPGLPPELPNAGKESVTQTSVAETTAPTVPAAAPMLSRDKTKDAALSHKLDAQQRPAPSVATARSTAPTRASGNGGQKPLIVALGALLLGVAIGGSAFWWFLRQAPDNSLATNGGSPAASASNTELSSPASAGANAIHESLDIGEQVIPVSPESAASLVVPETVTIPPSAEVAEVSSETVEQAEEVQPTPRNTQAGRNSLADIRKRNEELRRELGIER